MRRQFLVALSATVAALLIVTCAPAAIDSMRDGGGRADTADSLLDVLGTPDAAADTIVGACDIEVRNWIDYGDGRYLRSTSWSSEVDVPTLDPTSVESIFVVLCDYERFGPPAPTACPAGATCTIDPAVASPTCRINGNAELVEGRLRAYCGNRQEYQLVAPPGTANPVDSGERPRSVRFVIR